MGYLDNTGLSYFWGKIKAALNLKQDALVSGTNIKTVNNTSLLGNGNIDISGGGGDVFIAEYGVSTYAEILEAYEDGKAVFCKKVTSSSYQNTKVVTILPLAYIGSSDNASSLSRKAIFKNMSGNYPLYQTDITSYTLSGVTGTWTTENIETYTDDQGILSINKSGNSTYLYSNTVNGIVKDDGTGVLSAAVAGTDYQAPLVSGTNIKTINNASLLGSGNIDISGGGGGTLFVTVTYANYAYTADTTYADMMSAISAGKDIVVILADLNQQKNWYYTMTYAPKVTTENFCFASENETGTFTHLLVSNSDSWWAATDINLSSYATKSSPTFTGTPKAPTAAAGTNTTQIATTAFVQTAIANADDAEILTYGDTSITYADIATKVSAGKVLFAHYSTSSDDVTLPYVCTTASGSHVFTNMVGNTRWTIYLSSANAWSVSSAALAPLASPGFTGNPTAPTQAAGNNSTRIATTAFVNTAITNAIGSAISASY